MIQYIFLFTFIMGLFLIGIASGVGLTNTEISMQALGVGIGGIIVLIIGIVGLYDCFENNLI